MEMTLSIIKPDAVEAGHVGAILDHIDHAGGHDSHRRTRDSALGAVVTDAS